MPAPPDQFQKKTYVRLPFADDYLRDETDEEVLAALNRSFERPLLHVKISASVREGRGGPGGDRRCPRTL